MRWIGRLWRRWVYGDSTCESCGTRAEIVCKNGSTWCTSCHDMAIFEGYDTDFGKSIR